MTGTSRRSAAIGLPQFEESASGDAPTDSEPPAKQLSKDVHARTAAKTRARNRKISEEQQLQEATSILCAL